MAWPVRPEFFSLYQWKDLVYVSQISSENGPRSNVINIFQSDRSEAQMFCVSFNNLTVLTGLAVLKKAPLGLDLYHGQNIFLNFDLQKFLGKQTLFSQTNKIWNIPTIFARLLCLKVPYCYAYVGHIHEDGLIL
jgi:hypothetical protein